MASFRIKDLAAQLGINRVSFARLARTIAIPGLVRGPKGRWRLDNEAELAAFIEQYRSNANDRCAQISKFNGEKARELEAGIRFHGAGDTIAIKNKREIERLTSSGFRNSYTTTELAKILGVTTQTVRNLKDRIPGAKTVDQRLRFEKTEELRRYLDPKRRESVKVASWSKPRKSSWYDIEQPMLKGILPPRASGSLK